MIQKCLKTKKWQTYDPNLLFFLWLFAAVIGSDVACGVADTCIGICRW